MDANDILVFDLETTAFKHPKTGHYDPTPFNRENYITASGWKRGETLWSNLHTKEEKDLSFHLNSFKLLVGHNIKFDLLWLRSHGTTVASGEEFVEFWNFLAKNSTVWDTALAEYLCAGQTITFPSLEECCKRRGIPLTKTINLKEEIPKVDGDTGKIEGLNEYVKNDVEMTSRLFKAQMEDPYVQENFDWFMAQMEASLAECEIEYNGMSVDFDLLMGKRFDGMTKLADHEGRLKALIEGMHGKIASSIFNIGSNQHIAALLHGGDIKYETREQVGFYKSGAKLGQPRYKVNKAVYTYPKLCNSTHKTEGGADSTSDEALEALRLAWDGSTAPTGKNIISIIDEIQGYRSVSKSVNTTLEGIDKWSMPEEDGTLMVRPQMNNTSTITGRRSSSKPNGQNFPTNDPLKCKEVLGPRKKGRTIVSIDFKQAEIMGLAYVANDEKLMSDIIAGVDIHENMGKKAYVGRKVSKEERRVVKTVVFGTIYGGSNDTMAAQAGVPTHVVDSILDAFSTLYPTSWAYLLKIVSIVQDLLVKEGKPTERLIATPVGVQRIPMVMVQSCTGRRYAFQGFWRNFRKIWHVSLTQPKNYFIQGFATADLVPICVGRIWRFLEHHYAGKSELIGAIHDSVIFEVDNEVLDRFIKDVVFLINDAGKHLVEVCHMDRPWTMPVKCDIEIGSNLGDLKAYE